MDDFDDGRFNWLLRTYLLDRGILETYVDAPETVPHINPEALVWEMERTWEKLLDIIPQSHLDAVATL